MFFYFQKLKRIELKDLKAAEKFDQTKTYYIMSNQGRRALLAASFLKMVGLQVFVISGSVDVIKENGNFLAGNNNIAGQRIV